MQHQTLSSRNRGTGGCHVFPVGFCFPDQAWARQDRIQTTVVTAVIPMESQSGQPRRRDRGAGPALGEPRRISEHRDRSGVDLDREGGFPTVQELEPWNPDGSHRVVLLGLRRLHHPTQLAGVLPIERRPEGFLPIGLHRPFNQHGGPGHRLEAEPLEPERPAQQADDQDGVEARHASIGR